MTINALNRSMTIFVSLLTLLTTQPCMAKKITKRAAKVSLGSSTPQLQNQMPRWELRTAPIAFWANWLTLDLSYRISQQWAVGPAMVMYNGSKMGNMFAPSYQGSAAGLNANYYFDSVLKNTWYVSLHSYRESYRSYPHAYLGHKDIEGFRLNTAIGYQWRGPYINVMAGLGGEYKDHQITNKRETIDGGPAEETSSKSSIWLPHLELKAGIQF